MRLTKIIGFIVLYMMILSSCIKEFDPVIKAEDEKKLVITGFISDAGGYQSVNITRTSPVELPQYIPVAGCIVKILDNKGNVFSLVEEGGGNYSVLIDSIFILPGASYKLQVTTPEGDNIESDYDIMAVSPEVDSVYYLRENLEGVIPGEFLEGIQFYIDLDGNENDARYFRWELVETWEYHVDYPIEWYYDGEVHHVYPPDYSKKVCWMTKLVPRIFTLTTTNLVENSFKMVPLHFVDNISERLIYGYSFLIKQIGLSEAAYVYWDQLRINSEEQGGLYESQPLAIKGNMHNLTKPDEEVLGFFGTASIKSKRIFVQNVPNLEMLFETYCNMAVMRNGFIEIEPADYPGYLYGNAGGYTMIRMDDNCVNCLLIGGTNVKPDFWTLK